MGGVVIIGFFAIEHSALASKSPACTNTRRRPSHESFIHVPSRAQINNVQTRRRCARGLRGPRPRRPRRVTRDGACEDDSGWEKHPAKKGKTLDCDWVAKSPKKRCKKKNKGGTKASKACACACA